MIVLDTSVLINFFRKISSAGRSKLEDLLREEMPCAIPGICCQELLQGAKNEKEWKLLRSYLETQDILFPKDPWETHCKASRIYFDCCRAGVTPRSTIDCLIAQIAIEHSAVLLHEDQDFEKIKRVCSLKTMPL